MFRGYCKECKETISCWPEFVFPYQRKPLETHESAVVDHLAGKSFVETARQIGYDPRTIARWVMRIIAQAFGIDPKVIAWILKDLPNSTLPVVPTAQLILVKVVLAWLREFAEWAGFTRFNRLIGLANLLGQGRWNIWGAPIGKAKPRPGG